MTTQKIIIILCSAWTLFLSTYCGRTKSQSNKVLRQLQRTEVEVLSLLSVTELTEQYRLTFGAKNDTTLKLIMLVGKYEAQNLAITLENLKPTDPLPLDILHDAIIKFGYNLQEAVIDSLANEIYTAKIICSSNGKTMEFKARPVDAATLALKFKSPIFVNDNFLK